MRDYGVGSLSGVVLLSLSLVHELFAMSQPFGSDPDFHNPFSAPATAASGVQPQYSQRPASKPTVASACLKNGFATCFQPVATPYAK